MSAVRTLCRLVIFGWIAAIAYAALCLVAFLVMRRQVRRIPPASPAGVESGRCPRSRDRRTVHESAGDNTDPIWAEFYATERGTK